MAEIRTPTSPAITACSPAMALRSVLGRASGPILRQFNQRETGTLVQTKPAMTRTVHAIAAGTVAGAFGSREGACRSVK